MLPHLLLHGVQYLSSGYSTNAWGQQEPECSQSDDAHSDVSPWPAALQALMHESIGSRSLYLSAANSTGGRQVDLLAVGRSRSAANSPGSHQVDLLAVECSRSASLAKELGPHFPGAIKVSSYGGTQPSLDHLVRMHHQVSADVSSKPAAAPGPAGVVMLHLVDLPRQLLLLLLGCTLAPQPGSHPSTCTALPVQRRAAPGSLCSHAPWRFVPLQATLAAAMMPGRIGAQCVKRVQQQQRLLPGRGRLQMHPVQGSVLLLSGAAPYVVPIARLELLVI